MCSASKNKLFAIYLKNKQETYEGSEWFHIDSKWVLLVAQSTWVLDFYSFKNLFRNNYVFWCCDKKPCNAFWIPQVSTFQPSKNSAKMPHDTHSHQNNFEQKYSFEIKSSMKDTITFFSVPPSQSRLFATLGWVGAKCDKLYINFS